MRKSEAPTKYRQVLFTNNKTDKYRLITTNKYRQILFIDNRQEIL